MKSVCFAKKRLLMNITWITLCYGKLALGKEGVACDSFHSLTFFVCAQRMERLQQEGAESQAPGMLMNEWRSPRERPAQERGNH